ncbi:Acg family FMN-binding oxidoreductase [Kocuria turfanensis]|uniref:Tat pathway signal protein n=1 Tax=Kocuria turfanensis TaxID=388357 RepID=A0A512I8B6_9MICC|nr:nitroreductase family protein [Kocuria turfanensis]GEO93931.1 Tat pathway signal protein [Kocuria turfanensis]
MDHDEAVRETWRRPPAGAGGEHERLRSLVHHATLAPSSHDIQCWRFRLDGRTISILPDLSRRCPAVDPDDHHLYASLGCAAENLAQAARADGWEPVVRFEDRPPPGRVRVDLTPAPARASDLFDAILRRQSTRTEYDGTPLGPEELELLRSAGTGNGVRTVLLTGGRAKETVVDHVTQGNTAQLRDRAFVRELKQWIRFDDAEAVRTRDGLSGRATGNSSASRWIAGPLFRLLSRTGPANEAYARRIRSASAVAVLVSATDDPEHWVEAGRCYERLALQATALGVRHAFVNQPVEDAARRRRFAWALDLDGRPDLVICLGRGPEMPRSLRRPVDDVLR